MQRRTFLQSALAIALASPEINAQELGQKINDAAMSINPAIWPKERVERREYDRSRPDIIVWAEQSISASYPSGRIIKGTYGFLEGVATENMIPEIGGPLLRYDIPQAREHGFYFYFGMTIIRLRLPRTSRGKTTSGRYDYANSQDVIKDLPYPSGWITFDHRKIKIIEDNRISMPTGEIWHGGGERVTGQPPLLSAEEATHYPRRTLKHSSVDISGIVRFDIAHKPIRFRLELPSLEIENVHVPLPVCYFEPYDEVNRRWI